MALSAIAEETKTGTAVQLTKETEVRKEPKSDSPSYGILPSGTVVMLRGQREGQFLAIRVELEDGDLEGWIKRNTINRESFDNDQLDEKPRKTIRRPRVEEDDDDDDQEPRRLRPRSRVRIPKDEGLLLQRESTFFFGVHAGGGVSIMQDSARLIYTGATFGGGGHIGFYLADNIPVRAEVGYSQLSGSTSSSSSVPTTGSPSATAPTGTTSISFGFLDLALTAQYTIEAFEIFGTVQYSYGIGVSDLPSSINIGTAADLSSVWAGGGVGYRFPLSEVTDLALRAKYLIGFIRTPVSFQTISLGVAIEFRV